MPKKRNIAQVDRSRGVVASPEAVGPVADQRGDQGSCGDLPMDEFY